jgi:hypothetical protein
MELSAGLDSVCMAGQFDGMALDDSGSFACLGYDRDSGTYAFEKNEAERFDHIARKLGLFGNRDYCEIDFTAKTVRKRPSECHQDRICALRQIDKAEQASSSSDRLYPVKPSHDMSESNDDRDPDSMKFQRNIEREHSTFDNRSRKRQDDYSSSTTSD